MKPRAGLLLTCATGALLISAGALSGSLAADQPMVFKAAPVEAGWWFHGYAEVGGRFFLNDPQRDGGKGRSTGEDSLAKYYEYSDIRPGPFGNLSFLAGSNDGLYGIGFWANNIGYDDQSYFLDLSKAGEHYLSLGWDQIPHVRSMSALTLYNGVGTNVLTLPPGLATKLQGDTTAQRLTDINSAVHLTDIGIRRDTASVGYRYTPTDAWDIKADYSNTRRTGTLVDGITFIAGTSGGQAQTPNPVKDTTENYGASGEYAGLSPWGQKFNFKVGYNGSTYKDDYDSYTADNPFCGNAPGVSCNSGATTAANAVFSSARSSLWPDNTANAFSANLGAELPFKSRYMMTASYNMMRQNQTFLPFTNNPSPFLGGQPFPTLPASSLNGEINTLLINNVLTSQLTSDLKSKLSYRYYDFDNQTPELLFNDWVLTDSSLANGRNDVYGPVRSISISYTKQNAGAELAWKPSRTWNLGAAYGFERYDWTRADASATNEHSGKMFSDWRPANWITWRGSLMYAQRKYESYDYRNLVACDQWPHSCDPTLPGSPGASAFAGANGARYNSAYRQFLIDNRERTKINTSIAFDFPAGFTVTPTLSLQDDNFQIDLRSQEGVTYDHSWHGGAEVAYLVAPGTNFMVAYMHDFYNKGLAYAGTPSAGNPNFVFIQDNVDTVMAAVNAVVIPDKLDVRVSYAVSKATNNQKVGTPQTVPYPDVQTMFHRLETSAKYKLDDSLVQQMGWKGNIFLKARYVWEHNSVANWQNDAMQPYLPVVATSFAWLAFDNPNYDVHLLALSLVATW